MNLAAQLFSQALLPVSPHDVHEIVIFAPVVCDVAIYFSGALVPDGAWVTIGADGREHRLPDVPLAAGPAVRSQHPFEAVHLLERSRRPAQVIAHGDARRLLPWSVNQVRVAVFVNVDAAISAKVDRIGTGRERTVVE